MVLSSGQLWVDGEHGDDLQSAPLTWMNARNLEYDVAPHDISDVFMVRVIGMAVSIPSYLLDDEEAQPGCFSVKRSNPRRPFIKTLRTSIATVLDDTNLTVSSWIASSTGFTFSRKQSDSWRSGAWSSTGR